ncbi:MAG: single-stranded DNA-binding protein, partial [Gemmatimonadetes bacterium]|nr:single-stranded DNA-binding protein [Gemmatimonadota bacterium]
MASLRFHTPLGAEVWVPVERGTPQALARTVLEMQRTLGAIGWRGATPPSGGFRLPLANEPDFDWRLLGAYRTSCTIDGEEREGV